MNTSQPPSEGTRPLESERPLNPQYDDAGQGQAGAVPDLATRTVVAVFDSQASAERAAGALRERGIPEGDISVVRKGEETAPAQSAEQTESGSGTVAGAGAGALIGAAALGIVALAIPGVGPLIAAGPIAAALGGAVVGGAVGGLVGSFAGLGVPTDEAKRYEAAVRSGSVVVAVKTPDEDAAEACVGLLKAQGATDATSYQPSL